MALRHRLVGRAVRLYTRLRRPRTFGVRAVVARADGTLLLVRHTYLDGWYLPGGGVRRGESAEAAIRRELREEIGVAEGRIERLLGLYHSRNEGKDDHIAVVVVALDDAPAAAAHAADPREIAEICWVGLSAVPDDTSPATRRRIAEYRNHALGLGAW